jgi:SAM-dependent methyltransferase
MADIIFEDPRLVSIYDGFDGQRLDLENYLFLARELRVKSILDIGCGTGCLATLLAKEGFSVTGVEPAKASLDYARKKTNSEKVNWILGDATTLPPLAVDLAVMTGNVAQIFLDDNSWTKTLNGIRLALNQNGRFIFEVRDPAAHQDLSSGNRLGLRDVAIAFLIRIS